MSNKNLPDAKRRVTFISRELRDTASKVTREFKAGLKSDPKDLELIREQAESLIHLIQEFDPGPQD